MKKRIIAIICLVLLLFGVTYFAQEILIEKFINDSTTIVDGFYAEQKNSLDVVFIGSSNSFCTVDPLVLYENYGITSYNFASSSQPICISKLYAKEVFKHQKPKVIALEVNYIPGKSVDDVNESNLRWGLTPIPLSLDKMKCLKESGMKFDKEYVSYIFPIFRYHERWKEVYKTDFKYHFSDKKNYAKGYLRTDEKAAKTVDLSQFESEGGSWIEDEMIDYLDGFLELCSQNGAQVVFFKSPRSEWYAYQSEVIRDYADSRGIPFIDYNRKIAEIGIDPTSDFRDGYHLNNQGAAKVSNDLGAYLMAHYALSDHRNNENENSFDEALAYYDRFKPKPFMQATSLMECNELLSAEKDYIMVVTCRGGKNARTKEKIMPHHWVYVNNKLVADKVWDEDGVVVKDIGDTQMVLQKKEEGMQVIFNNINYPAKTNNWSVVVYDMLTEQVVADLGFDN